MPENGGCGEAQQAVESSIPNSIQKPCRTMAHQSITFTSCVTEIPRSSELAVGALRAQREHHRNLANRKNPDLQTLHRRTHKTEHTPSASSSRGGTNNARFSTGSDIFTEMRMRT